MRWVVRLELDCMPSWMGDECKDGGCVVFAGCLEFSSLMTRDEVEDCGHNSW